MDSKSRVPLKSGDKLEITVLDFDKVGILNNLVRERYNDTLTIKRLISRYDKREKDYIGSSCLVYEGVWGSKSDSKRVIVKEFYPQNFSNEHPDFMIKRDQTEHTLSLDMGDRSSMLDVFSLKLEQFLDGYEKQNRMSQDKNLSMKEFIVLPLCFGRAGDSFYILSDIHDAFSLDQEENLMIEEKIEILLNLAQVLKILEDRNEIFFDLALDNVMYIHTSHRIQLFDVDSVIDYSDLNKIQMTDIRYHESYASNKLFILRDNWDLFERKKWLYLSCDNCKKIQLYSYGVFAYGLIFGYLPNEFEREWSRDDRIDLIEKCLKNYNLSKSVSTMLVHVIERLFKEKYRSAADVEADFAKIKKEVDKGNRMKSVNFIHRACQILDEYPVYEYRDNIEGKKQKMTVVLIGRHPMRTAVLKAVIPGVQMLDTNLNIRLYAEDVNEYWQELCKEMPELNCCVDWYDDQLGCWHFYDTRLVDHALAQIELCPHEYLDQISKDLSKENAYIWCMHTDNRENIKMAETIAYVSADESHKCIIYLDDNERKLNLASKIKSVSVSTKDNSVFYDEHAFDSNIEKMGYHVHAYYYLGNHPKAKKSDIIKDYQSNPYYKESSERSALHIRYKLASLGLYEWSDEHFLSELYYRLFDNKNSDAVGNFNRLAQLEHLSWEAFMIVNGWSRMDLEQEFLQTAYCNGNTWKDNINRKHPYLVSSATGRKICRESDWDKMEAEQIQDGWDELDRASVSVYHKTYEIAKNRYDILKHLFKEAEQQKEVIHQQELYDKLQWMKAAINACYALKKRSDVELEQSMKNFEQIYQEMSLSIPVIEEILSKLEVYSQPLRDAAAKKDIKIADENVIQAIPQIIVDSLGDGFDTGTILIRPFTKNSFDNVYAAMLLRPAQLIYLSPTKAAVDLDFYKSYFKDMGLVEVKNKYSMKIKVLSRMPSLKKGMRIWFDVTGCDQDVLEKVLSKANLPQVTIFKIVNNKIQSMRQDGLDMLRKKVLMSVEDLLRLKGIRRSLTNVSTYITQVSPDQYRHLWKCYQKLGEANWKRFIEILQKGRKKEKIVEISLQFESEMKEYQSIYISGYSYSSSNLSGIVSILEEKGFLHRMEYPKYNETMCPVKFETKYPELGIFLSDIILKAEEDPMGIHEYALEKISDSSIIIEDRSLYQILVLKEEGEQTYFTQILNQLNDSKHKYLLFHKIQITEAKITLRYASEGIRDLLESPDNLLKGLIYFECYQKNTYTDLKLTDEFIWDDHFSDVKKMDLIGVRENKLYGITHNIMEQTSESTDFEAILKERDLKFF